MSAEVGTRAGLGSLGGGTSTLGAPAGAAGAAGGGWPSGCGRFHPTAERALIGPMILTGEAGATGWLPADAPARGAGRAASLPLLNIPGTTFRITIMG